MIRSGPENNPDGAGPASCACLPSHGWTAGFKVPTMKKAAMSTRKTGRSLKRSHRPARTKTSVMIVEGASSNRITRYGASPFFSTSGFAGGIKSYLYEGWAE